LLKDRLQKKRMLKKWVMRMKRKQPVCRLKPKQKLRVPVAVESREALVVRVVVVLKEGVLLPADKLAVVVAAGQAAAEEAEDRKRKLVQSLGFKV
jgi:hypothetical protein